MKLKAYWYPTRDNVGDTLTPCILKHFTGAQIEWVPEEEAGKVVAVGSVMTGIRAGDTVFGTGVIREADRFPIAPEVKFLSVRGKLSRRILQQDGGCVPEIYGDPALLLPFMYYPKVEKAYDIGYVPHYVDKNEDRFKHLSANEKLIDVALPWQSFIEQVLLCKKIISSSLHGIIIAEAYGIPAQWAVYSDKVIGNGFKFRDYLTGTGRQPQEAGEFPPIDGLEKIQSGLIEALKTLKIAEQPLASSC